MSLVLPELPGELDEEQKASVRKAVSSKEPSLDAFAHMSDEWVAARVRMLMRDDLWHEPICCAARDRIVRLALKYEALLKRFEKACGRVTELESVATAPAPPTSNEYLSLLGEYKQSHAVTAVDALALARFVEWLDAAVERGRFSPSQDRFENDDGSRVETAAPHAFTAHSSAQTVCEVCGNPLNNDLHAIDANGFPVKTSANPVPLVNLVPPADAGT